MAESRSPEDPEPSRAMSLHCRTTEKRPVHRPPDAALCRTCLALILAALLPLFLPGSAGAQAQWTLRTGVAAFDVEPEHPGSAALDVILTGADRWRGLVGAQGGAMLTTQGTGFAHAGINLPLRPHPRATVTPSLGMGLYFPGDGPDLGSPLQFRSEIVLSLRLRGDDGISLFLYHLSNASMARSNPGAEALGLAYSLTW